MYTSQWISSRERKPREQNTEQL
jgi:hypothetical protein